MKAYVTAAAPAITGMHAHVGVLYDGPEIVFVGVSDLKRGEIRVYLNPMQATELAIDLLRAANKHGADTQKTVATALRRLEKKL